MKILIGFIGIMVIAVIGWLIAEIKYKTIHFTRSEADIDEEKELEEERAKNGFKEMTIEDIKRTNSTKGFNAVG